MPVPSDAATPPPACSQRLSSPHCKVPARRRHHWLPPVVAHSSSCRTWRIRGSLARLQLLIADDPGCIGQTTGPQANRLLCSAAASYRMRYIDTGRIVGWADAEFQRPRFPPCEGFHADGPRKTAPPVSGRHCRDPCFPPLKHLRHALPVAHVCNPSLGNREPRPPHQTGNTSSGCGANWMPEPGQMTRPLTATRWFR